MAIGPGKPPANDPAAEAAVLGACMIEAAAVQKTMLILEQGDFYHQVNATIFQAIADLAEDRGSDGIDPITVGARLREAGLLEQVGGTEYLMSMIHNVTSASFCERYARVVRDCSLSRGITSALRKTYEEESPEALSHLTDLIMAKEGNGKQGLFDFRTDLEPVLKDIAEAKKPHYRLGFDALDEMMGGVEGGECVTIGARTSGGKTAFMLRVALNMAMSAAEVLYITSEMRLDSIIRRILPQAIGIPSWKFRKRLLNDFDREAIVNEGHSKLSTLPIKMLAKGRPSIRHIREAVLSSGCKVVFVDYLQRCKLPKASMESTAIYDFMAEFKEMLLNTQCVGFMASQLDRKMDKTPDDAPTLSDFRGSSGIESESDISILLWRPKEDKILADPKSIPPGKDCIRIKAIVAKNRDGGRGKDVDMDLNTEQVRFLESKLNGPQEESFL